MHGRVQLFERREQALEAVGQLDGRGGVGQHRGRDDEQHQADHHKDSRPDALAADMQETPLPDILARRVKEVEHGGEHDDEQHRFESAHHELWRDARNADDNTEKRENDRVGNRAVRQKQQHDERDREHDLDARIEPVHGAVAREKLADRDILEHQRIPPFCLQARSTSSACSTVKTEVSTSCPRFFSSSMTLVIMGMSSPAAMI